MVKTQVYLAKEDLEALHRVARKKKRRVADLVREAVREVWLGAEPTGPVALSNGLLRAHSSEHDAAFDER
jgi:hypothetical protein